MIKIGSLLFGLALPLIVFSGEEVLTFRIIPSPNLVKNADFSQINENGHPAGWRFDNCSKSPHFKSQVVKHPGGNYLAVNSEWNKFGYWLQFVPVKEGEAYVVSCEVQSDAPNPAVWLLNQVKKASKKKSPGKVQYIITRSLRQGDELKEILSDFVDEKLIINLSPVRWNSISSVIFVPLDLGINRCAMRVGIYGGNAGQARFRNPVFREAKSELEAEIRGAGWKSLRIKGAKPESIKLDPAQETQKVSFVLPKALFVYKAELTGSNGREIHREVANE